MIIIFFKVTDYDSLTGTGMNEFVVFEIYSYVGSFLFGFIVGEEN